jgi:hypothetical protein
MRSRSTSCTTTHSTLTGNHPRHYPVTPAMAAGLADHVWTVEEVCALLDPARVVG